MMSFIKGMTNWIIVVAMVAVSGVSFGAADDFRDWWFFGLAVVFLTAAVALGSSLIDIRLAKKGRARAQYKSRTMRAIVRANNWFTGLSTMIVVPMISLVLGIFGTMADAWWVVGISFLGMVSTLVFVKRGRELIELYAKKE